MEAQTAAIREIEFASGAYRLRGTLHLPAAGHPPVVIGCHGLLSTQESPKQIALARRLAADGMAFFRFDHRGCGRSEGDFRAAVSLEGRVEDLLSAWRRLRALPELGEKLGLFGSSMGGAVCIAAASLLPAAALVTFAAPFCDRQVAGALEAAKTLKGIAGEPEGARPAFDLSPGLAGLSRILIIHGDQDPVVTVSSAREIFRRASAPKRLLIQEGGDHPMSDPAHQKRFMMETAAWFKTHLA